MKEYIKTILKGGSFLEFETDKYGIEYIFQDNNGNIVPFEKNCNQIYEQRGPLVHESYWEFSKDKSYYIQVNEIPNDDGCFISLYAKNRVIEFEYVKNCRIDANFVITKNISRKLYKKIKALEAQGIFFDSSMKRTCIIPEIYKLKDGWLIFNSEVVYGRHPRSISIIARNNKRAQKIQAALIERMQTVPKSFLSRHERFHQNKHLDNYNQSEECNHLRYKYFSIIKSSYENYNFSRIFEFLEDNCFWIDVKGKKAVIEKLEYLSEKMKEQNISNKCTLVQVGRPIAPVKCNTKLDGSGEKCFVGLFYNTGEICMVVQNQKQMDFLKMEISPNGQIYSLHSTLPSGDFYPISVNSSNI